MTHTPITGVFVLLLVSATLPAKAAGNAATGANLFEQECAECHSAKADKHKKGPSLFGVVGRKAGAIAEFTNYSEAMKTSGATWTADNLSAYVKAPKSFVSGGRMKYEGLGDDKARSDLITFLATLH